VTGVIGAKGPGRSINYPPASNRRNPLTRCGIDSWHSHPTLVDGPFGQLSPIRSVKGGSWLAHSTGFWQLSTSNLILLSWPVVVKHEKCKIGRRPARDIRLPLRVRSFHDPRRRPTRPALGVRTFIGRSLRLPLPVIFCVRDRRLYTVMGEK
jgi:hypothetical protein